MISRFGNVLVLLICPYCQGKLVRYGDYMVCKFHKFGYPIAQDSHVDFRRESVRKFDLDELDKMD